MKRKLPENITDYINDKETFCEEIIVQITLIFCVAFNELNASESM